MNLPDKQALRNTFSHNFLFSPEQNYHKTIPLLLLYSVGSDEIAKNELG